MSVPTPPVKLEGHCSVIHDNTLYTYSADGFAYIPLRFNGTWHSLDAGVPVSNAACVKGGVDGKNDQQALYVIGGTSSSSDYTGIQRFLFQSHKWEPIDLTSKVTQNRTHHGAAYLNSTSSILVYGGSDDGNPTGSTQTFAIYTGSPYNISSYSAKDVPPGASPVLLPWNDEQAALLGGPTSNDVFLFSQAKGWSHSGLTLSKKPSNKDGHALVNNPDGSKILQSFHMNDSPNTVSSVPLLNPGGQPASPDGKIQASSLKEKRGGGVDYPKYNDTLAPMTTRKDYSLAHDDQGQKVVISGGQKGPDPLAIFNQASNGWINATELFNGKTETHPTSSPTPSATHTSLNWTPTPSTLTGSSKSSQNQDEVRNVVGATVGCSFGAVILLILAMLFLGYRQKKQEKAAVAGPEMSEGGGNEGKVRLSSRDGGTEPLAPAAYPMARSPVPVAGAASSVDSLGIFSGKAGNNEKSAEPVGDAQKSSPLATVHTREVTDDVGSGDDKGKSPTGQTPDSSGNRKTDEGWGKYFDGNNTSGLAALQGPPHSPRGSMMTKSDYRGSEWPALTPLDFGFLDHPKPLGHVVTGSPTTEHANSAKSGGSPLVIPECQSARISSAESLSNISEDDYYERGDSISDIPRREHQSGQASSVDSWVDGPVSTYSGSYYNPSSIRMSTGPDLRAVAAENSASRTRGSNSVARRSSILIPDAQPTSTQGGAHADLGWLDMKTDR